MTALAVALWCVAVLQRGAEQSFSRNAALLRNASVENAGISGLNLSLEDASEADPARLVETLAESGFRWLRFTLPWDLIEPNPGELDWEQWDRLFGAVARHEGVQPVAVLDRSPDWSRTAADSGNAAAPPHERSDFGAFCAAVATRYGEQVRFYQVWDEPNIYPHWGERAVDPADYLGLLRECALQLREHDADATIVLAALAPTVEAGGANLSDIAYLDALYSLGAEQWFDVVAIQPYGFSEPPAAGANPGKLNFARSQLLRQVMVVHGDGATPLWATKFGWAARSAGSVPAGEWGSLTEEQQAEYTAEALRIAASDWPWLGPLFWPAWCSDPQDGAPSFSLCPEDDHVSPTWESLTAAAAPRPYLAPGRHAMDSTAIDYSLGWRVADGAADPQRDGDSLAFWFYGSGVSLSVRGGSFWSYAAVTIDGHPSPLLPRDQTGEAYLVLYDPLMETRNVPLALGLPVGLHEVQLSMTGGWGQWPLLGVEVTGVQTASTWRYWALAAALSTAAAAFLLWPRDRRIRRLGQRLCCPEPATPSAAVWALVILCTVGMTVLRGGLPALAAIGVIVALSLRWPVLLVASAAAMAPFVARPLQILGWQFSAFELLVWLGAAARLVRVLVLAPADELGATPWVRRLWRRGAIGGLDWPVGAFLIAGLASTAMAVHFGVAAREYRVVFLTGGLLFWLVSRLPERSDVFAAWGGFLAGAAAVAILGLWQLATGQGRIDVEGVWRVRALYGSPNNLALLLVRAIPVALSLSLFASLRRGWRASVGVAVTAVLLAGCLATFSKGAFLLGLPAGIGCVLILGGLRLRRPWPWAILAALALLAAGVLAVLFRTARFADLLNLEEGTTFIRLRLWQSALQMALDHPWLGVGPDNFLYAYRTVYVLPSAWEELNLSHPHNIFLDFWTRLGAVGTAAGAWMIAAVVQGLFCEMRGRLDENGRAMWALALGMTGAVFGTLAHGLIDNSLFLVDLMAVFMLIAGSLELARRSGSRGTG